MSCCPQVSPASQRRGSQRIVGLNGQTSAFGAFACPPSRDACSEEKTRCSVVTYVAAKLPRPMARENQISSIAWVSRRAVAQQLPVSHRQRRQAYRTAIRAAQSGCSGRGRRIADCSMPLQQSDLPFLPFSRRSAGSLRYCSWAALRRSFCRMIVATPRRLRQAFVLALSSTWTHSGPDVGVRQRIGVQGRMNAMTTSAKGLGHGPAVAGPPEDMLPG